MSKGIKRGITLRATLVALICAIALYVATIAAVIVLTITPTASSLRRHSEALQSEFVAVQRDDELGRLSMHFNEMTTVLRQRAEEEKRRQEVELDKQRAYLDELFEGAPEAIVLLDTNDRVLRTNSEFTRMFGYTQEDVLHKPFNDRVVPPEQKEEGLSFLDKTVRGERVNVEEFASAKTGLALMPW